MSDTLVMYPDELGGLLIDGFARTLPEGRLRTRMQSGHMQTRRIAAFAIRQAQVSASFNLYQLSRFWRFWDEDTQGGVLPFLIKDQETDRSQLLTADGAPILTEDGIPILITKYWLCVFGDTTPVESSKTDNRYTVTFELDVHP